MRNSSKKIISTPWEFELEYVNLSWWQRRKADKEIKRRDFKPIAKFFYIHEMRTPEGIASEQARYRLLVTKQFSNLTLYSYMKRYDRYNQI